MNFSKFWVGLRKKVSSRKQDAPRKKESFDQDFLCYDLFYQLSYMSSIAAAGLPRSQIFDFASRLPCISSRYFAEIHAVASEMRYDYSVACRMVGEATENDMVRSLLLRLSSSMGSGESEAAFLEEEARIQAETYRNEYERAVETLRMWTEAYAALIVAASLVVIVAAISMIIYPVALTFTVALVGVTICVAVAGAWAIHRVSPKERRVHSPPAHCAVQTRLIRVARILIPAAIVAFLVIWMGGLGLGWALMAAAALVLPVGVVSATFDRQITKKDMDISTFLRSLGNVATAIGVTASNAVERLDLRATANLSPDVVNLRDRLNSRLQPDVCWQRFSLETGSETVYRSVKMFHDANRLGGEPEQVGQRSSLVAMTMSFLRARRTQVSTTFGYLVIAMHVALTGLLVFVIEVLLSFGQVVEGISSTAVEEAQTRATEVFSFSFGGIEHLESLTIPTVLVLSITNAVAMKAADGGNAYKICLYLAWTLGVSGLALIIVPILADGMFSSVTVDME